MKKDIYTYKDPLPAFQDYIGVLLENLPSTIFVKDAENLSYIYVNKSAENFFGFSREELIGKNDYDFWPKEQADFFTKKDREVLNSREALDIPQEPIETKNMGLRILHTKKVPICDHDGNPLYLVGISEDITELKEAQDRLNNKYYETQNLYHAILENTADGIITFQADGKILSYNKACKEIFDYNNFEVIGKNFSMLLSENYSKEFNANLQTLINGDKDKIKVAEGKNINGKRKNGAYFPIELSISRVDIHNKIIFSCIVRDITERKQTEKKIFDYTKKLEISNRELDDFAHIASHDLKEPLRGLYIYTSFLMEDYADKLDSAGVEKLNNLQEQAHRMESLINDLMKFSQLSRINLVHEKTDLNPVLENVLKSLGPWLEENNTQVLIKDTLPEAKCDQYRVSEVFRNLITNAVKYNDKTNKVIEIGTTQDLDGWPNKTVFYVKDNGIGIAPGKRDHIFKIFKRLHAKDKFQGGTGAGLTIVEKIIQRHGGEIWFDSILNQGTTFYFTLEEKDDG